MSDLVEREEVIKAIDKRICELQRHPIFKRKNADIDLYGVKKLIMRLPSARPNNRGICGVCAGRKVCGRNNRNLDMMQCSIFELDERYKISRPKGEWTSVLAELHERFSALEKEIRKASAEMSAVIREYVDKGETEREGE